MLPTLSTPRRLSLNPLHTPGSALSNLPSPRPPLDEYPLNATKAMRFSFEMPSKTTLGPVHTGKALVKRSTPNFPKRNKTANGDNLDVSEGFIQLDIDTALEVVDPKVL
jgi:hypothetical protein